MVAGTNAHEAVDSVPDIEERMDSQALRKYKGHSVQIKNGRVRGEAWNIYKKQIFSNLLGRTGYVVKPKELISKPALVERDGTHAQIKIACISSPISVRLLADSKKDDNAGPRRPVIIGATNSNGTPDLQVVVCRDDCNMLQAASEDVPMRWERERLAELDAALKLNPDIICFGEYSYPPVWPDREIESRRIQFQEKVVERLRAVDRVRKKPPFVFLGSYHCLLSLYHFGVLYPWGSQTKPRKMVSLSEPDEHGLRKKDSISIGAPVPYRKRYPARSVGEQTRVPAELDFKFFKLPIGRVGVAICSDVVDLNQFLSIARYNLGNPNLALDVLMVPSFNRHDDFLSMCRELSHLAGFTVVAVNANPSVDNFPKTEIFCGGLDFKELNGFRHSLGGKLIAKREQVRVPHAKGRVGKITAFTLNRPIVERFRHSVTGMWIKSGISGNIAEMSI